MSPFFGLTSEYKRDIHKSIFQMITYGKGGWTYDTLYNMPIRLRALNFQWLREAVEAENAAMQAKSPPRAKKSSRS